jgi:hypothetical protein
VEAWRAETDSLTWTEGETGLEDKEGPV